MYEQQLHFLALEPVCANPFPLFLKSAVNHLQLQFAWPPPRFWPLIGFQRLSDELGLEAAAIGQEQIKSVKDKVLDLTAETHPQEKVSPDLRLLCTTFQEASQAVHNTILCDQMMVLHYLVDPRAFALRHKHDVSRVIDLLTSALDSIRTTGVDTIDGHTVAHSLKVFPRGRTVLEAARKVKDVLEGYRAWLSRFTPAMDELCPENFNITEMSGRLQNLRAVIQDCPPTCKEELPTLINVDRLFSASVSSLQFVLHKLEFGTEAQDFFHSTCLLSHIARRRPGAQEAGGSPPLPGKPFSTSPGVGVG